MPQLFLNHACLCTVNIYTILVEGKVTDSQSTFFRCGEARLQPETRFGTSCINKGDTSELLGGSRNTRGPLLAVQRSDDPIHNRIERGPICSTRYI